MNANRHQQDYDAAAARLNGWVGRPVSFTISLPSEGAPSGMVAMFSDLEICRVEKHDTELAGDAVRVVLGVGGRELGCIFVEKTLLDEAVFGSPFDLDLGLESVWLTVTDETPEEERRSTLLSPV